MLINFVSLQTNTNCIRLINIYLKTQVLEKNFEKDIDYKILEEYTEEFLLQKIRSKVLLIKK